MSEQLPKPNLYEEALVTEIAGREIAIIQQNGHEQHLQVHHDSEKPRLTLIGKEAFDSLAENELAAQSTPEVSYRDKLLAGGEFGMKKPTNRSEVVDVVKAPEKPSVPNPDKMTYREQLLAGGERGVDKLKKAHNAERAERRERLEHLLAKQALRNDYKARGRKQAEQWQSGVEALREAAKPASEKLSYRERLLAGGELGVVKMAADEQKAKEHAAHNRVMTVAQSEMSAEAKATAKAVKAAQKQAGANLEIAPASSYKEQLEAGGSAGVKKIGGVIRAQEKTEQPKREQKGYDPKSGMTYREWLLAGGELSQKSTKASVQTGEKINRVDIAKLLALGRVAGGVEAFKALKANKLEGTKSEDVSASAESLLNAGGVLDLDRVERVQDATQSPVAGKPAPVPAVRPIHRPATRPNTQPRRRGVRGLVAAGVATIAALGVWAGFSNHSGESMAAAIGMSQPKDGSGVADKNGKGHELSPETIAAAQKQAAKLKAEAELYKNQTEVTGASGETATTKPLERGSNPWDEARKMLESYDLPTTDANINAVDKAIQKRMGQIDYTRMLVGMQVPWFGEDRVRQILGDYDNTTPGK
jgi:hypothetical protein